MLKYSNYLQAKYIVFHLNNSKITDKDTMLKNSLSNLNELFKITKIPLLVENTGIKKMKPCF